MATHFRFSKDFDFRVSPLVEIAYKAGTVDYIPEAHAKAAEAAGAGERVNEPPSEPDRNVVLEEKPGGRRRAS